MVTSVVRAEFWAIPDCGAVPLPGADAAADAAPLGGVWPRTAVGAAEAWDPASGAADGTAGESPGDAGDAGDAETEVNIGRSPAGPASAPHAASAGTTTTAATTMVRKERGRRRPSGTRPL
ncbi:hypothetical protein AB4Y72_13380 [Arthrobacter sp. YAF34]|uniref:hypothetical protein n=1 Tax=Arthrobacter sp. YAF34 TaxID=3233083 RepID=UPI003F929592